MEGKNIKNDANLLKKKKPKQTSLFHTFIDSDPEDTNNQFVTSTNNRDSSSESKCTENATKINSKSTKETNTVLENQNKIFNTKQHRYTRQQTKAILEFQNNSAEKKITLNDAKTSLNITTRKFKEIMKILVIANLVEKITKDNYKLIIVNTDIIDTCNEQEIKELEELIYQEDIYSEIIDSNTFNTILELESMSQNNLENLYLTQEDVDTLAQIYKKECYLIECKEKSNVEYSFLNHDIKEEKSTDTFNEILHNLCIDNYTNDQRIYKLNSKNSK